jgi:hypothetical protein
VRDWALGSVPLLEKFVVCLWISGVVHHLRDLR